jgi:hypothetical protein
VSATPSNLSGATVAISRSQLSQLIRMFSVQGASLGLPATTSHGAPEKRSEASHVTFNAPSTQ